MKKLLCFLLFLCSANAAFAQGGGGSPGIILPGITPVIGGTCPNGQVLFNNNAVVGCQPAGSGSVTSVGLALPASVFSISGSPVTTSGTLTGSFVTQTANTVFAGPTSGIAATPAFRALVAADVPSSILPGGFSGFATCSQPVGLAAVAGAATTAPRSDGACALDQTAAFAFTGLGNTNLLSASQLTWNSDLILTRGGSAATLQLGGATTASAAIAQTLQVQGSSGNSAARANFTIAGSDQTGTGTTGGALVLRGGKGVSLGGEITFQTAVASSLATAMTITQAQLVGIGITNPTLAALDIRNNSLDNLMWGSTSTAVGVLTYSGAAGSETSVSMGARTNIDLNLRVNNATRLTLSAGTPGLTQFGAAASATPVNQTIQVQGSRAGTDSNVSGANLTVQSGQGTGNSTTSTLALKTPVAVASGTGAQTMTTGLLIKDGTFISTSYTVATLPASPQTGARAHVTDAVACTFLSTLVGSSTTVCPVFYNGTAWVGG